MTKKKREIDPKAVAQVGVPELEADEQEIFDNFDKYETREMDENGKMVKLKSSRI